MCTCTIKYIFRKLLRLNLLSMPSAGSSVSFQKQDTEFVSIWFNNNQIIENCCICNAGSVAYLEKEVSKPREPKQTKDYNNSLQNNNAIILPPTFKCVTLKSRRLSEWNPQKYSPESDWSTFLILRKRVEMLVVISNFPFRNPSLYVASRLEFTKRETYRTVVLLTNLNQKVIESILELLVHCRVTSSPGWTFVVWKSEAEMEIPPETMKKKIDKMFLRDLL